MSDPHSLQNDAQGWKAQLQLNFEKRVNKTVLASRSQLGPLTVQRPFYPEGGVCHLYLLHPPGGVVGGDELHINVGVRQQAHALITTPGATKFYRNNGKVAKQLQTLKVQDKGILEWFPQENIFFDDTHTQLKTQVELNDSAQFLGWEINCYGRPASNDLFQTGFVDTHFTITRNGTSILLDRLKINSKDALYSSASLNAYPCFATFIATNVTKELLDKARLSVEEIESDQHLGLTLLDDVLVARCLAKNSEQVSTTFKLIWNAVRPDVTGKNVCHPRIWAT